MNNIQDNAKYLIKDLIQGEEKKIIDRDDYKALTHKQQMSAFEQLINDPKISLNAKNLLLNNSWRLLYRQRPPSTMEEFLTVEWLGNSAEKIYPHIRNDLSLFFDPNKQYRNLYLAGAIGYGKSFASTLAALFVGVNIALMRNPKKVFNVNVATSLAIVFGSFTLDKAKQVLLGPFFNILKSSPKFRNVKVSSRIPIISEEEYRLGSNKIVWSTASRIGGCIEFPNDLHTLLISSTENLLGLSILVGILSELNFFLSKGISPETIDQFRTDLEERIYSRFSNNYWGRLIVDSSPNSISDSILDKLIFGSNELQKNPKNLITLGKHWEIFPDKYPIHKKTGETFKVFRGSGAKSPKILLPEDSIEDYSHEEILDVPIDIFSLFENNIVNAVKNYGDFPTGSEMKVITNFSIIEKAFTPQLLNEYDAITAPASKDPKQLIWDQIRDKYFIKVAENKWEFYRAPGELRWLTVDQSETKDVTGIGMVHPEIDVSTGEPVIIVDFLIPIVSDKEPINVDAAAEFIFDLHRLGGINFGGISFDTHQSVGNMQRVERELEIKIQRSQCDLELAPYNVLVSKLKQHLIKCGKSIFLKNNLKSLQETTSKGGKKKKIDHTIGKIVNVAVAGCTWETDLRGIHAKDISDTLAQSTYQCLNEFQGIPKYTWVDKSTVGNCAVSKSELEQILKDKFGMEFRKL